MRKFRILTLALLILTAVTVIAFAAQDLIITYEDGNMQKVTCSDAKTIKLSQASSNITEIEIKQRAAAAPAFEKIEYVKGFAGTWDSNWGKMELRVNGLEVDGNYTHDQGKISAKLSNNGKEMVGTWSEAPSYAPPQDGGKVTFSLSADGNSLTGHWWYGENSGGGGWTGTRID